VTRKNRRDRKNALERAAQAPAPPADQPSGTPAAATRPGAVFAIVAGLIIVVVGGGFLVYWYTQRGPSGPNPQVVMETSEGTIKIELFQRQAPITVENFLKYVDAKFYDGTVFHRVMPDFMIQCGGFLPGLQEKPTRGGIRNESYNDLENTRGTLAMARTNDPDSASAQFFINRKDNAFLNRVNARDKVGYAVFGKVISGMDVVDKIAEVKTATRPDAKGNEHENVPVQDVIIKSVRRVEIK
jgi:cyclophilin family peptidyl-prolyl cis-trans isomerase